MIGCWFYVTVIGKDAEADFCRWHELPFPPAIGQRVTFDPATDDSGYIIESVTWVYEDGEWNLWVNLECWQLKWELEDLEAGGAFFGCGCLPEDNCCRLQLDDMTKGGWELFGEVRQGASRSYKLTGMWPD